MNIEARWYEKRADGKVECGLCPHRCVISPGNGGICRIRKNIDGQFMQTAYAEVAGAGVDPIEKKPLYHFHPGSQILSVGTNGCNLTCPFCQNWNISTSETERNETSADYLVKTAKRENSIGAAYTYNEPLVWYEFVYDCSVRFREAGLKNIIVSNGFINEEPMRELAPLIDAANIDLKGYTEDFYKGISGRLEDVKRTIRILHSCGVHLELTNLVIPGLNDDMATFTQMIDFIAGIDKRIPLHLSRYFPNHKSKEPATPTETLQTMKDKALKKLHYVYLGNVPGNQDTFCPSCSRILVNRSGYRTQSYIGENICPHCSAELYFSF
ncbi:AmmeMemoRadiSam system radical SAM enzyme [Limisalsivibrio acetivorans]|uniref:AmmeMemoRadiSam system radical SAM enzyme n=1 Tax=Limisalsivibrio acetivorans TaxID=1304888 RepID=UPI0003B30405|nr:AmmeMemoRadiSam system radical SAM enzyme [Limisalsivibrio acetivorans]